MGVRAESARNHEGWIAPMSAEPAGNALADLAVRAAAGDEEAFEALLAATQRRVSALAYRLLGSREDARDATQEVYLRVHRSLKGFRPQEDLQGWLYRIALNVCRDHLRRRRPALPIEEHAEPSVNDDVEGRLLESQRGDLLRRALAALPPKERFAVVMRDLEGLPTVEVARALGSSAVTVRTQICSARKRLKALFAAEGRRA